MAGENEVQREIGTTIATEAALPADRERLPFELEHPYYVKTKPLLDRFEAVTDGIESEEERKRWLPQFPFELDDLYGHRIATSVFLGGSQVAVERLVGAVFASEPQLLSKSKLVTAWLEDVDGEGTCLRDLMEEASGEANTDGIHYALVTKTGPLLDLEEGQEASKAQELEAGESSAAVELIDARNVPSWGMRAGRVVWAGIRQVVRQAPDPDAPPSVVERWRLVEFNRMRIFERELKDDHEEDQKLELMDEVEHNLGRLPLVPVYGGRRKRFQGDSYIKAASRADLAKLREDSWGQQARNIHANPVLALKSSRKLKEIWIGGNAVRLEPDEEMAYVPLDSGPLDQRTQASERFTREAVRVTGSNPSFTSDGLTFQGESGVAQRQRFSQTEQRYIQRHTRGLERATTAIMDIATLILEDVDEVEAGTNSAQYFNTFEVLELESLVRSYNGVALSIESPTFHRTVQTQLALRLVADAPQETREAIRAEIEEADPLENREEDDEGGDSDADPRQGGGS